MTAIQLGLFPGCEQVISPSRNKPKKLKQFSQATIIEEACTTARAAELLKISPTTLYRAKNQGQSYRRDRWTVIWLAPNSWQVMHDRT